jgi:hypothetical protein
MSIWVDPPLFRPLGSLDRVSDVDTTARRNPSLGVRVDSAGRSARGAERSRSVCTSTIPPTPKISTARWRPGSFGIAGAGLGTPARSHPIHATRLNLQRQELRPDYHRMGSSREIARRLPTHRRDRPRRVRAHPAGDRPRPLNPGRTSRLDRLHRLGHPISHDIRTGLGHPPAAVRKGSQI